MFRNCFGSLVLSLCCFALHAEDWIPVYEESRHKPVFENDLPFYPGGRISYFGNPSGSVAQAGANLV